MNREQTIEEFVDRLIKWAERKKCSKEDIEAHDEGNFENSARGYNEAIDDVIEYLLKRGRKNGKRKGGRK